ncbi:MAG: electron transfer flavoprotein subunit alpha/FixB family protein [Deltaproteobacteria bacterium]|nr:electron transfer flavoprotein subunit alpha/FixB family protein [Deltaproteobacteria bacterium]
MNLNVLLYLEHDGARLQGEMARLVDKGNELARELGGFTVGALVGDIGEQLSGEVRGLKCKEIVAVSDPSLGEYQPELFRSALESILDEAAPHVVLFRHSYVGMELAPALAYRRKAPIISNCLDLAVTDSRIEAVRPYLREVCWGRVSPQGKPPYFFTLQRFPVRAEGPAGNGPPRVTEIRLKSPAVVRIRCRGIAHRVESEDISKAERIVAAGRGIGAQANLKIVQELAEALGATVACSRPIADLGWLPVERQVGISGKTVSPKVYVACGISGESQHVAGMKDSSLIIAINSDPRARIFRVAHYGVVTDLVSFLPVLTNAALQAKRSGQGVDSREA